MPTNLIVNGTFDAGAANWSGTDIEASNTEGAYLGNGSTNRVAEMNGGASAVTVMQQSFTVTDPTATELTFDAALRSTASPDPGVDGFTVDILDSGGNVIATMTLLPTNTSLNSFSLPVNFPTAGTYTIRFTEEGVNNDGSGAIVDNISILVCFGAETLIQTANGRKRATDLKSGDLVLTEAGLKPLIWVGRREVTQSEMAQDEKNRPVKIEAGALGQDLPEQDLWVSRQHRMLVRSREIQNMFGMQEVLLPAIRLVGLPGIAIDETVQSFEYVHFLFDHHAVVLAEGAPAESMLWADRSRSAVSVAAQRDILRSYPRLQTTPMTPAANLLPRKKQVELARRLQRAGRPVLECSAVDDFAMNRAGGNVA